MQSLTSQNTAFGATVISWCQIASCHFDILAFYALYQQNVLMTKNIVEKTKDVESIYIENSLIANKVDPSF